MIYFLAAIAAISGFLFGYDEGVIAVARPLLDKDFPMSPGVGGFMTAAVPLGALVAAALGTTSLGQAGFVANMADVAPTAAGAMFGLCNTFGSAAGIAGVVGAGAIVQATGGSFAPLFLLTAGLYCVGAAVFATFASGEAVF